MTDLQCERCAAARPAEQAGRVNAVLTDRYPKVGTPLRHRSVFELLVATILSAQTTDEQVNRVTPALFERLATPEDFAGARLDTIERLIRPTGLFRHKAKNIRNCARRLLEKHGGKVPDSLEALVELPGVGRKTANVVLSAAFDVPAVVVDTHVARVCRRLGLTDREKADKIEADLTRLLPSREWREFSLRLIFFGRDTCTAKNPDCPGCPLNPICPWPRKTP